MDDRKITTGRWVEGYGNGLTGPTTASCSGPCCGNVEYAVVSTGRKTIAIVPEHGEGSDHANAKLISAAPELLEALELILSDPDYLQAGDLLHIHTAEEAIKKALGK